jgi:hypothetical protein
MKSYSPRIRNRPTRTTAAALGIVVIALSLLGWLWLFVLLTREG